jgi:hypothetical protein
MQFTDILSFCFSILGLYGLFYYPRFLIPRNLLPYVSAVLTEAEHLLDRAESTGVIPRPNDHRSALTLYKVSCLCQRTVTSLILTVIPINSYGFGWKAIVLLEYYSNFGLLFSTV